MSTKTLFYTSLLLLLINNNMGAQTYQQVWSDEFNGTGLPEPNKWGYELGGNTRNNELQYYTNSTNNVKQNNGNLEITVLKENVGGKNYTSGSVISLNKASWTYGKIEGRFKMPMGKGLWACLDIGI
ncbi:glycoside hydrolase family 16 protein [Flavobacterium circumlabens]|uniref:Glycoside hydrolase family 16 protein n=1 Tax=Flavobacterium circumlabens TaxID=2133765 RepID=A0A4Y7UFX8_9FLAO|nr:glycoside hydrolase family 16 protein [Flavobacterium circumlabens]TCN59516.1 glycosyl hydrolase family 16 [Flavobacterium circumlabens]TEB44808.1 glycoside hydrolase family 16 protein [Flavobacterium circumlabens]